VSGDVQRPLWTRCGLNSPLPSASGEVFGTGEPLNEAVPEHLRHTYCSSHENPNLLRSLACHVTRGV